MSIAIAHGYSVFYANQTQSSDLQRPGSLAPTVFMAPGIPGCFFVSGYEGDITKQFVPSNFTELSQYNSQSDFDGDYGDGKSWEDPWADNRWVDIGGGRFYRWDGGGGWVEADLANGVYPPDPAGEIIDHGWASLSDDDTKEWTFIGGRWPKTKKELDTINGGKQPFVDGDFVSLKGYGGAEFISGGKKYYWDGTKWLSGVSPISLTITEAVIGVSPGLTAVVGNTTYFGGEDSTAATGTTISLYEWDIVGTPTQVLTSNTFSAQATWAAAGTYTVSLAVTDSDGGTSSASVEVTVTAS